MDTYAHSTAFIHACMHTYIIIHLFIHACMHAYMHTYIYTINCMYVFVVLRGFTAFFKWFQLAKDTFTLSPFSPIRMKQKPDKRLIPRQGMPAERWAMVG